MDIPPIPSRIYKAVAHLEKTKQPGQKVGIQDLNPARASANYVEWLLLLNVIKVIPPERQKPSLSPFKQMNHRGHPEHRQFEYVGTPEGWKDIIP